MRKTPKLLIYLLRYLTSWYALFLYAFVLFFLKSYFTLDPDFGWHITLGKYILLHGIPRTDPFSYSMPSYPFVDHEWLTNIGMFLLFTWIGKLGMAILWSIVALFALGISVFLVHQKYRTFEKVFFLLSSASFVIYIGIRTQVLSWLFFMVLIFFLFRKNNIVQLFGSGVVVLLWVNMHGSFPIALVLIALAALVQKQKKLWVLLLASVSLTFANPYGLRLWGEVWNQLSDSSLRFSIYEWFPSIFYPSFMTLWLFVGVIGVVALSVWKKVDRFFLVLFILFVLLGASSVRHMPFVLLIGISLGGQVVYSLQEKAKTFQYGGQRFFFAYRIFAVFSLLIVVSQLLLSNFVGFMSEESFYPQKAAIYLQTHLPQGNLLSTYDWGGYLIWKLPEKKVFIDGRMPSWRWKAPSGESDKAFAELTNIFYGREKLSFIEKKYKITTFLLRKSTKKIDEKELIKELLQEGYVIVFQDGEGIIYEKKSI